MARLLYCRWDDCRVGYASVGGDVPTMCPQCGREARWSTMQPEGPYVEPRVPYALTRNDRRLLKALRIATEEPDVARD